MRRQPFFSALILSGAMAAIACGAEPKRLLLIGQGPDGHPPQTHEYMPGLQVLAKCLRPVEGLKIETVNADGSWPEGPTLIDDADGVVLFLAEGAKWIQAEPARLQALRKLAARGGGIVALHWAIGTREAQYIDPFVQLVGGCHGGPDRRYKVLEELVQVADRQHPITFGIADFRAEDEFYYGLKFVRPEGAVRPVLRVRIEGEPHTVAWSWERADGGRSFGFSGLHFHRNWRQEPYRRLVAQGALWTLKLPVPAEGLAVAVNEEDLQLRASK